MNCSFRLSSFAKPFQIRKFATNSNKVMSVKFLGQQEAIDIDQELFNEYVFSVDQLMELAGLSCAQALNSVYKKGPVLVLSGPGNNGGDGFVCSRHLKLFGFEPTIIYPKPSKSELMQRLVKQNNLMGVKIVEDLPSDLSQYNVIVDAFFGFSFKPPIREPFGQILQKVVDSKIPVFSIDIPSGWNVETGPIDGVPNIASESLISLTAPKKCAQHFKGKHHFLGGRFVPEKLASKYSLNLPDYPDSQQFIRL
ncbi:NAD(P)H-hydrate epimerase [Aphelenchoides bicaudatus]|nr:NAD(P)H-hydrate epimerase [Aphelenchoides bicaudatus]